MRLCWEELTILLVSGDLLHISCDAIVNSSNIGLVLGKGFSEHLRLAAGPGLQRQMQQHAPLKPGQAVVTGAGRLKNCSSIIHVATIGGEQPAVQLGTANALRIGSRAGLRRLAFPALGTGTGCLRPEQSALGMAAGIREFRESVATPLRAVTVTIAFFDPELHDVFADVFTRQFGVDRSHPS